MRAHRFNSFFCFIFLLLVFSGGLALVFSYFNPVFFESLKETFLEPATESSFVFKVGLFLTLISGGLFFVFYQLNKQTYYQVELNPDLKATLNPHLITSFLSDFFEKHYSSQSPHFHLKVNRANIEILVDLSDVSMKKHEKELKNWEKTLLPELCTRFGIPKKTKVSVVCHKL